MTGAVLFLLMFVLIAPQTRTALVAMLGHSGGWVTNYAPFSYVVLGVLLVSGVFALNLMVRWPKVPEPENPLAKYKRDELADYD